MSVASRISLHGKVIMAFLFTLGIINFADKAIIGFASGPIIAELHLTPAQWGLIGGSFYFLFSVSSIGMASWSDAIGGKRVLALLGSIWAFVQLATIFISGFVPFLLLRILLGAGEGPSYAVSTYVATKWLPPTRRAGGIALITLGSAMGPALLAPLLTLIVVAFGWRSAFGLLGGIGLLWVALWLLWGRKSSDKDVQEEPLERAPAATAPFLKRVQQFFITRRLLSRNVLFVILGGFAAYWYLALLITWTPSYLIQARHLHPTDPWYLIGISLPWLIGGIVQVALGGYADHRSQKNSNIRQTNAIFLGGVLITGAALLALAMFVPWTPVAILLLACSPLGTAFPLVATLLTDAAPKEHQGSVQGFGVGIYSLAGIIAPTVTGIVIQLAGKQVASGYRVAYLIASTLILLAGIAIWGQIRTTAIVGIVRDAAISTDKDPDFVTE